MAADAANSQYSKPAPWFPGIGHYDLTGAPGSETNPAVAPRGETQPVYSPSTDTTHVGTSPLATTGMCDADQYSEGGGGFAENTGYASTGAMGGSGQTMTRHPNSTARPE